MLPVTERWMSIWQQSGLPLDQALRAATAGSLAVYGYVESELQFQGTTVPDDGMLNRLPNARLLFNAEYDAEAEFELLVRSLVDGLCARLTARDGSGPDPR
nr:hypothetical protein [Micromonospora sp. DSM 115978]